MAARRSNVSDAPCLTPSPRPTRRGLGQDSPTIRAIVKTLEALKAFADFGAPPPSVDGKSKDKKEQLKDGREGGSEDDQVDLRLSYTINLVLPKTTDVAVFNAIFKSLKENLLRK